MASLTETAYYARVALKYGGIALVALIVGRFVLVNGYKLYLLINPPPEPPPTVGFGTLPELVFPKKEVGELTYRLETPTGSLPDFTDRLGVYPYVNERPNLLALERAGEEVAQLNFKGQPEQVSESMFRWRNSNPVNATLEMHIFRGTFVMKVDWTSKPEFLSEKQLPSQSQAVVQVQSFLNRAHLAPDDLVKARSTVSFLRASGRDWQQTGSLSEADFVQVDLFRAPINEYTVLTPEPSKGIVRAVVSGNSRLGQIVQLEYTYFPVDYERVETYPLKPISMAWEELQAGSGYVAELNSGVEEVVVRRIGLGYYDTYEPQAYLQPIFVFTGDNNFVAYVPAVLFATDTK